MKKISTSLFITLYFLIYLAGCFLFGLLLRPIISTQRVFGEFINNNIVWIEFLVVIIAGLVSAFIVRKHYMLPVSLLKISSIVVVIFFTVNVFFAIAYHQVTTDYLLTIVYNVTITGVFTYVPLFIVDNYYNKQNK